MKLYKSFFYLIVFVLFSCEQKKIVPAKKNKALISYINPFIGTGGHRHTYPGATMPFGMMQLSPDIRLDGWDGCSGYHYSDDEIYGFSHTHLSGTGVSDYGDILLMPTNKKVFNNGANGKQGYKSKFSNDTEVAEPSFYKVHLDDTNIDAELTVSKRSGMHKYQFPKRTQEYIVLDLEHRDKLLNHQIKQVSPKIIHGYRDSSAWAADQKLFYCIAFSHEVLITYPASKKTTKAIMSIHNPKNKPFN